MSAQGEDSPALFEPSPGYLTKSIRSRFLRKSGIFLESVDAIDLEQVQPTSLKASADMKDLLFFWQIYSVTGKEPIERIIANFYGRIFSEKCDPWFRSTFESIRPKEDHIQGQLSMWLDCFGGGRYEKGEMILHMQHRDRKAIGLMNQKGAEMWVHHMKAALDEEEERTLRQIDPRLRVALNTFLQFFVESYSKSFGFKSRPNMFGETHFPKPSTNNSQEREKSGSSSNSSSNN